MGESSLEEGLNEVLLVGLFVNRVGVLRLERGSGLEGIERILGSIFWGLIRWLFEVFNWGYVRVWVDGFWFL